MPIVGRRRHPGRGAEISETHAIGRVIQLALVHTECILGGGACAGAAFMLLEEQRRLQALLGGCGERRSTGRVPVYASFCAIRPSLWCTPSIPLSIGISSQCTQRLVG